MITLEALFQNMSYGELTNLAIGNAGSGTISEENYERVVSHVCLGLTALHQRFLIRTGQVLIRNYTSIGRYYLDYAYARSNEDSTESIKYIEDSAFCPFEDNVLKIEQVFDELGREYEINNAQVPDPIFTPQFNCIAMTPGTENTLWNVVYRADHPAITVTDSFDPADVTLHIPQQYVEPLQAYVAARLMRGMSHTVMEGVSEGDKYMAQYELLCSRLEQQNLDVDDNEQHNRLEVSGWV